VPSARLRLPLPRAAVVLALLAGACGRTVAPAPSSPASPGDPFGEALGAGDRAWASREDPAQLDAALAAFRRAAALRPGDADAELRLARAEALRAQVEARPAEARARWDAASRAGERALRARAPAFAAAIDRGEDAVAAAATVDGAGAEPLYWLAVGRLRVAQATGPMAVLVTKDVVLGLLDRALAPEDPFRPVLEAETLAVLVQDGARFDALLAEVMARDPAAERPLAAEIGAAKRMAEELKARRARLF
jgi:hypothetical protein